MNEGDRDVFVVIVECECPDRWWAQPEGGYFPTCGTCGQMAQPRGGTDMSHRRERSIGGLLTVEKEIPLAERRGRRPLIVSWLPRRWSERMA